MGGGAGFAGCLCPQWSLGHGIPGRAVVDLAVKETGGISRLPQEVMLQGTDREALFLYICR